MLAKIEPLKQFILFAMNDVIFIILCNRGELISALTENCLTYIDKIYHLLLC